MVRDKVAWMMKALPKRIRTQLIPVPEHVTKFLEGSSPRTPQGGNGPGPSQRLRDAVIAYASRVAGERIASDVELREAPPPHLTMNIRVVDEAKRELAMGRDLGELRRRLARRRR
jgi:ATP-dependent helicase HrpA